MRSDLVIRRHEAGGWTVKDPLSLQYLRLSEIEMAVLRMLDGRYPLERILTAVRTVWPDSGVTPNDLADLLSQFAENRLIVATDISILRLTTSPASHTDGFSVRGIFRRLMALLCFRIRLFNPSPLLDVLSPLIRLVFSRGAAILLGVIAIAALTVVVIRFDQFVRNLPGPEEFFAPDNLLLLLAVFVTVKGLHELGHACAARHFGAECHEAGIMLLLLTPVLYTNVSDAWILDRRSRLLITASGILVEVALAAVCAILWSFAAPGLTKSLLANTMVLCTVTTIAFNANPLVRFDGYFLLADSVGRPNLAQQAAASVRRFLENVILGPDSGRTGLQTRPGTTGITRTGLETRPAKTTLTKPLDRFLLAYGLASAVYRTILGLTIVAMLLVVSDRWRLGIAGQVLATMTAVSFFGIPVWTFLSGLLFELWRKSHRTPALLRLCFIAAALCLLVLIPLPQSITVPATVEPSAAAVFATLSGELVHGRKYGDRVARKQPIADLRDEELQQRRIQLSDAVQRQMLRIRSLELRRDPTEQTELPEAKQSLSVAVSRLTQFESELERLSVSSPNSGILFPPRSRTENAADDEATLRNWSGVPLDPANTGAFVEAGTLLGHVGDRHTADLRLCLTEDQVQSLRRNDAAEFQPSGNPAGILAGHVELVSPLDSGEIAAELTAAGLIAPLQITPGRRQQPTWTALVQLAVQKPQSLPRLYSTGLVRVRVQPSSIATRLGRYLQRTF